MGRRAVRIGALTGHPYAAVNLQCEEELATFKKIPEASEMYQMVHAMEIRSCDDLNLKKKKKKTAQLYADYIQEVAVSKTGSQSKLPAGSCAADRCFSYDYYI